MVETIDIITVEICDTCDHRSDNCPYVVGDRIRESDGLIEVIKDKIVDCIEYEPILNIIQLINELEQLHKGYKYVNPPVLNWDEGGII